MFDTMTFTKLAGGVCGALLIFLLGKWAAEGIYHMDSHGEASYVIDTGAEEEEASDEPEVDFAALMASADVGDGAKVFKKCSSCHKLEVGGAGTGPYLAGIVGRPPASVEGFGYSNALAELETEWTPENLSAFLENPKAYAPGNKMTFPGLKKIDDRASLIAYLATIQ